MRRFARLAVVSVACLGLTSVPLFSQSQPTPPQPAPTDPAAPQQPVTPPQSVQPQTVPADQAAPQQPVQPQTVPADQAAPPQPAAPATQDGAAQEDATPRAIAAKGKKDNGKPIPQGSIHNASLWQDPGDIASKDLFYGPGGPAGQPAPPFKFLDEDTNGTNPKFDVQDANNKKWRVKLGEETRPEVVASRLLWAIGYYANDDYLLHVATIENLKMKRGASRVRNGDQVIDARFSRKPGSDTKVAIWQWKNNPFRDTREFNGLRVMMAVINSWDLKDVNNAVYTNKKTGQQIFLVSDVGATFATNALSTSRAKDKGNVNSYKDSKFIVHTTETTVDFGTPAAPTGVLIKSGGVLAGDYVKRHGFDWIGDNIPREDARWIGSLLGQLSHQQLIDAFRAGNFPAGSIDSYVQVVESRIAQLKAL